MTTAATFSRGDLVEVWNASTQRWQKTVVDASPEYGYVLVAGVPGRAGPLSVRVSDVRPLPQETPPKKSST